jgi:membrane protease YdiL (CAAX protease family)
MELIGIGKNWKSDILIGLGGGALFIGMNQVSPIIALGNPLSLYDPVSMLGRAAVVCVAAPFTEEGLFRSLIPKFSSWAFGEFFPRHNSFFSAYLTFMSNPIAVTIASGGMFAGFHYLAYGLALQTAFVGAFVFGEVAGALALWRKSLTPGIITHGIFNGFLFGASVLAIGGV